MQRIKIDILIMCNFLYEIDEIIPKQTTFLNNVTFGLDDGLLRIDDAFRHFSSSA